MSRHESNVWFEKLCALRDAYRATERASVMSIGDAIEYAEQLLAGHADAEPAVAETAESPTESTGS